jgi:hypothetical protein
MKTYQGSCHCKRVRFEADIDFQTSQTTKCNCTSCFKRRWWAVPVKPDRFRLLAGQTELSPIKPGAGGGFCKHCGLLVFGHVEAAEWNDGEYYSVNVAALDGLEPSFIATIPVHYLDGLHDAWQNVPAEIRYL